MMRKYENKATRTVKQAAPAPGIIVIGVRDVHVLGRLDFAAQTAMDEVVTACDLTWGAGRIRMDTPTGEYRWEVTDA